jgi:hypothetical protein
VEALVEHAAQAYRVDPEARRLRAIVRVQVEGAIGVTVDVAIEAGDAEALGVGLAVVARAFRCRSTYRRGLSPVLCLNRRLRAPPAAERR